MSVDDNPKVLKRKGFQPGNHLQRKSITHELFYIHYQIWLIREEGSRKMSKPVIVEESGDTLYRHFSYALDRMISLRLEAVCHKKGRQAVTD